MPATRGLIAAPGPPLAVFSVRGGRTARKIAERVYRMLKYGQEYVRQSKETYDQTYQQRLHKSLAKKAASLGYKLVPETMTP